MRPATSWKIVDAILRSMGTCGLRRHGTFSFSKNFFLYIRTEKNWGGLVRGVTILDIVRSWKINPTCRRRFFRENPIEAAFRAHCQVFDLRCQVFDFCENLML